MDRDKNVVSNGEDDATENREAIVDDTTRQEHADRTGDAEGQTTFGDDKVTPRLNDGR